jgi:hypothetical protein
VLTDLEWAVSLTVNSSKPKEIMLRHQVLLKAFDNGHLGGAHSQVRIAKRGTTAGDAADWRCVMHGGGDGCGGGHGGGGYGGCHGGGGLVGDSGGGSGDSGGFTGRFLGSHYGRPGKPLKLPSVWVFPIVLCLVTALEIIILLAYS